MLMIKKLHNHLTNSLSISILILLLIFIISIAGPAITGLQTTPTCGAEEISSTAYGETHLRVQTGGSQDRTGCPLTNCGAGMYPVAGPDDIFKDSSGAATKFTYQLICMRAATDASQTQCTTEISSEANACTPSACPQGLNNLGTVTDLYKSDLSTSAWYNRVYRFCAVGGGILGGSTVSAEQSGSFPSPPSCPSGYDVGTYKNIHFKEGQTYRAYRICVNYAAPLTPSSTSTTTSSTTSSSTTTTIPPTTSSSTSTTTTNPTTSSTTTTVSRENSTELISKVETKLLESPATQNTTQLEQAKDLLAQAKLLEADKKYEEAKQKAQEAITLLDAVKEQQEKTSFNLLVSMIGLVIIALIVLGLIYQSRKKEKQIQ